MWLIKWEGCGERVEQWYGAGRYLTAERRGKTSGWAGVAQRSEGFLSCEVTL